MDNPKPLDDLATEVRARAEKACEVTGAYELRSDDGTDVHLLALHARASCPANVIALLDERDADKAEIERLRRALAVDARVDTILSALLVARGDLEDGTRDHLPRQLRDYIADANAASFKTGWDDGYAEGHGKAEAEIERLTRERDEAILEMSRRARLQGEAEGKLRVSELAGVVEGWQARAEAAEAHVAEMVEAARSAVCLLQEVAQGNPARSPGHNAQVILQSAIDRAARLVSDADAHQRDKEERHDER